MLRPPGPFRVGPAAGPARDCRRYAAAVGASLGWTPEPGRFHLFAVIIGQVTFIRYDDATGDQYVALWPPAREFVRRGTTATSLGEPEARQDMLVADTR